MTEQFLTPHAPGARAGDHAAPLRSATHVLYVFASSLVLCFGLYLWLDIPERWFPASTSRAWGPKEMTLARGTGSLVGEDLVVTAADPASNVLVTLITDFPSRDYAGVAWIVTGVPPGADIRLLWRTRLRPDQLNSLPVEVEAGRTVRTVVAGNPAWIGQISGLALAVRGNIVEPLQIRGVLAKPMGLADATRDRFGEWLAFEGWSGSSINTMVGGAEAQRLPLPLLLAGAALLTVVLLIGYRLAKQRSIVPTLGLALLVVFFASWAILDARWTWNLGRQLAETIAQYGGKDLADKHLASSDAGVYAFVEKAGAVIPRERAKVFVVGDVAYLRGRAAYHLYPHNVFTEPVQNAVPPASTMRKGDWIMVLQKKGMQYDRKNRTLRWEGGQSVMADLVLLDSGYALLRVE